jgi:hypothetical protein
MAFLILREPVRKRSIFYEVIGSLLVMAGAIVLIRALWLVYQPRFKKTRYAFKVQASSRPAEMVVVKLSDEWGGVRWQEHLSVVYPLPAHLEGNRGKYDMIASLQFLPKRSAQLGF